MHYKIVNVTLKTFNVALKIFNIALKTALTNKTANNKTKHSKIQHTVKQNTNKVLFNLEDPGSKFRDPGSNFEDPGSKFRDPGSNLEDPGSGIQDPRIQDPRIAIGESATPDTGNISRALPRTNSISLEYFLCRINYKDLES